MYEGVRKTRARYLYDLASECACPPPVVDAMRVTDFAILTDGLDARRRALEEAGRA